MNRSNYRSSPGPASEACIKSGCYRTWRGPDFAQNKKSNETMTKCVISKQSIFVCAAAVIFFCRHVHTQYFLRSAEMSINISQNAHFYSSFPENSYGNIVIYTKDLCQKISKTNLKMWSVGNPRKLSKPQANSRPAAFLH